MHVFLPIMSDVIHIQIGYSPLGQINLPGYEQKSLALHFEKKQADNVADTQSDTKTDSNLVALRVKPHLDQKQDICFKSSYKLLGSTFFYLSRCPDLPSYLDA